MSSPMPSAELAGLMQRVNAELERQDGGPSPAWVFLGDPSGWEVCVYPEFQPQLGVIHRCGYQLPLQPDGLHGTYLANVLVKLVNHPGHDCREQRLNG